jgi:hypothetical protein
MPSYDCALHALRSWLDSWAGIVTEVTESLKEGLSQARVSARVELQEAYSRDLRRLLRLDDERRTQRPQRQPAEERVITSSRGTYCLRCLLPSRQRRYQ